MSDSELEEELMSHNFNDYGRKLVLAEINRRFLEKSIRGNFLPRWTGWVVLVASVLAALFSILAVLR
ncbi:MAG: hypothetical protein WCQ16_07900 [Verrucomicrobiae bacterium]